MSRDTQPGDVIFEFLRIGTSIKVTAIDTATLTEVSIVVPASSSEADMRRAALRKLVFMRTRGTGRG